MDDEQLAALRSWAVRYAAHCLRSWPRCRARGGIAERAEEIAQDKLAALVEVQRKDQDVRHPKALLRTAIRRAVQDASDKRDEGIAEGWEIDARPGESNARRETRTAPVQELARSRDRLRRAVDLVRWEDRTTVRYFAVFLYRLRLALLDGTRRALLAGGEHWEPRELRRLGECLCPWQRDERQLAFRSGYAAIQPTWHHQRAILDEEPARTDGWTVCQVVNELAEPGSPLLRRPTWDAWTKRAKDRARQNTAPATWKRHFGRHFPDKSPRTAGRRS